MSNGDTPHNLANADTGFSAEDLDKRTDQGETRHTKSMARSLAEKIADKNRDLMAEEEAGTLHDAEGYVVDTEEEIVEVVEGEGLTGEEEIEYIEEEVPIDELQATLAEYGVELEVNVAELPEEQLGTYEILATATISALERAMGREMAAQERMMELEDFSNRLEKSPDKILLALAIENPRIWAQVSEIVSEMEENPKVKEVVIRELESEIRLAEADRKDKVREVEVRTRQGRKVSNEVTRQAKRLGVPVEAAQEYVAAAVKANNNWLEVHEVEPLIRKLVAQTSRRRVVRKVRPKKVTPEQRQKAAASPTHEVGGTPGGRETSPGLKQDETPKHRGGIFKGLVKQAARRTRTSE